ncbi:MAG TPA: TetR/AcrR family transcriptional regulator [Actinomycetes bacterium]|nr:TetR/AcrR family transcriptional regulator [Actinomycetes bacterium]
MTLAAKAPDERRRRILAAAIVVLRERGFSGTRVADIAATAGTSPALVLYHFSSLADVLVASLESVEDEYYADLARHQNDDPRDRLALMGMLNAEVGPAFGDWQLWLEVWVRSLHDERIDQLRLASDRRWREAIGEVIDEGVRQGMFTTPDRAGSTLRIASLQDGLAVQAVLGGAGLTPESMSLVWLVGVARELGIDADDLLARAKRYEHVVASGRHDS